MEVIFTSIFSSHSFLHLSINLFFKCIYAKLCIFLIIELYKFAAAQTIILLGLFSIPYLFL